MLLASRPVKQYGRARNTRLVIRFIEPPHTWLSRLTATVGLPVPPLVEATDTSRVTSALLRQAIGDPSLDLH
jgi:hypothetical protein